MTRDFWYGIGVTVIMMIIHWWSSRKDPLCRGDKDHTFDDWRISGTDAAQVKTCKVCGFSKKIPLD